MNFIFGLVTGALITICILAVLAAGSDDDESL